MNWKRVISGVLAAVMLSALPVQLLVSAEGTEAVGQADGWEELTTLESLDESNTFFYSKDDQTFEKITHPEKDVKTADGIVDYLGDGAVAVVTDPEDAAYNAGDRGQNYAWSAVGYGDWLYVGTCYAAIGNTLSLMKSKSGRRIRRQGACRHLRCPLQRHLLSDRGGWRPAQRRAGEDQHQDRRDQAVDVRLL